jgi:hypothetical protein
MFSAHPGLRSATAAVMTTALCFSAVLPQKSYAAPQEMRAMIWTPGGAMPNACESLAALGDSNRARELSVTAAGLRVPCDSVPIEAPTGHGSSVPDEVIRDGGVIMLCTPGTDAAWNCKDYESVLRTELQAMGKNGEKIGRARARVLEILGEPTGCAAWFQQKDPNAMKTFRSLSFALDTKGTGVIEALRGKWPEVMYKNPYVARVIQDGGAFQTITLNINGAFFQASAIAVETRAEGGLARTLRPQEIGVGPFRGGSLGAQVVAILHELGHLEGMLPQDEGDVEGRSRKNTQEVLQNCRAEVESSGKRTTLTAAR